MPRINQLSFNSTLKLATGNQTNTITGSCKAGEANCPTVVEIPVQEQSTIPPLLKNILAPLLFIFGGLAFLGYRGKRVLAEAYKELVFPNNGKLSVSDFKTGISWQNLELNKDEKLSLSLVHAHFSDGAQKLVAWLFDPIEQKLQAFKSDGEIVSLYVDNQVLTFSKSKDTPQVKQQKSSSSNHNFYLSPNGDINPVNFNPFRDVLIGIQSLFKTNPKTLANQIREEFAQKSSNTTNAAFAKPA